MTRFKKCEMIDCDRTATRKVRLYLPIEEEHLGPVKRTHMRNEGFEIRTKSCPKKDHASLRL